MTRIYDHNLGILEQKKAPLYSLIMTVILEGKEFSNTELIGFVANIMNRIQARPDSMEFFVKMNDLLRESTWEQLQDPTVAVVEQNTVALRILNLYTTCRSHFDSEYVTPYIFIRWAQNIPLFNLAPQLVTWADEYEKRPDTQSLVNEENDTDLGEMLKVWDTVTSTGNAGELVKLKAETERLEAENAELRQQLEALKEGSPIRYGNIRRIEEMRSQGLSPYEVARKLKADKQNPLSESEIGALMHPDGDINYYRQYTQDLIHEKTKKLPW